MVRSIQKPSVGIHINVTPRVKATLDAQAQARGYATSAWAGMLLDAGFAAVVARDKGQSHTDADLDAIVGATLLLTTRKEWDTTAIAKQLGIPESTVERILDGWRSYRRGK
jgi:sirohydrochlorin ferrochelatase